MLLLLVKHKLRLAHFYLTFYALAASLTSDEGIPQVLLVLIFAIMFHLVIDQKGRILILIIDWQCKHVRSCCVHHATTISMTEVWRLLIIQSLEHQTILVLRRLFTSLIILIVSNHVAIGNILVFFVVFRRISKHFLLLMFTLNLIAVFLTAKRITWVHYSQLLLDCLLLICNK